MDECPLVSRVSAQLRTDLGEFERVEERLRHLVTPCGRHRTDGAVPVSVDAIFQRRLMLSVAA